MSSQMPRPEQVSLEEIGISANHNQTLVRLNLGREINHNQAAVRPVPGIPGLAFNHNQTVVRR